MKGIVFTEFIEMMEEEIGVLDSQEILGSLDLADDGSYTAIGDYPHGDLVKIISRLSTQLQQPVPDLLFKFGEYFAKSVRVQHSRFFDESPGLFDFLESVHNYIHVEVLKLYPNAKPPDLIVKDKQEARMTLHYSSHRGLGDFAEGLIRGVADAYDSVISIVRTNLNPDGTEVLFEIEMKDNDS